MNFTIEINNLTPASTLVISSTLNPLSGKDSSLEAVVDVNGLHWEPNVV
jgi:hypothetical protein